VGTAATPAPLSEIIDRPCSFLSPAVDTLRFCPFPNPPDRTIDVWAMGRRARATHDRLVEHARQNPKFMYLYDSVSGTHFYDGAAAHRELMASLLKRSRYFIADRAKANEPEQTKGQQVFGPRFFEGAAAGAILVGEPPESDLFNQYFDWTDAVVRLPYGSTEIVELLEALDRDPERVARARLANVVNSLRRHDWLYRWEQILQVAGLEPAPAALARRTELERRACAIEGDFSSTTTD
jgi:hypothetical protein